MIKKYESNAGGGARLSEHFSSSEFECLCGCGFAEVSDELISMLETARAFANELTPGIYFRITSGCRCSQHNATIKGASEHSEHLVGLAADIHIPNGLWRYTILQSLLFAGFERIGLAKSFIHAGVGVPNDYPIPVVWTY